MPAVSVLMAVYNGERHLAPAIDSILAQTFTDFELIVVDDGSIDGSRTIVEQYGDARIRLLALDRNQGLSHALNAGLRAADSPLVARQDADDLSEPHRLATQVEALRQRPELAILGSQAVAMHEDGTTAGVVWRPVAPAGILWYSLFDNPFAHTSMMFRTAVVRDALGGFNARYDPFSQDYALWCDVIERHAFANLPDRLVRYRVHGGSIIGSLDRPEDDAYRQRFAAIVREIIGSHARRLMTGTAISDEEVDLLASFVLGLHEEHIDRFLALFERLLAAFLRRRKEMQELDAAYVKARETDKIIPRLIEMLDFHINNLDEKMANLASLRKEIVDYRQRMIERFQLHMK
jgi:glycosyltransferase involved in cell wall biosynthesis